MTNITLKPREILNQEAEIRMLGFGKEQILGMKSLPELSNKIWGLGKGKMVIIAARTSIGKTAFLLQIASDFSLQGYKVLYLSLEMSTTSLWIRNFCREQKIDSYEIFKGGFTSKTKEWKEYSTNKYNIKISDCLGRSWKEIDEIIESTPLGKPDVIFIDHLNEIRSGNDKDKQVIDDYLIKIRAMAVHNNITFIIGAQINRTAQGEKDKLPMLHHLKGSGKIEETADIAIILHWPHYYDEKKDRHEYNVIIAKNREGRTGMHIVNFYPEYSLFTERTIEQIRNYRPLNRPNKTRGEENE